MLAKKLAQAFLSMRTLKKTNLLPSAPSLLTPKTKQRKNNRNGIKDRNWFEFLKWALETIITDNFFMFYYTILNSYYDKTILLHTYY